MFCYNENLENNFKKIELISRYRHFLINDTGLQVKERFYEGEWSIVEFKRNPLYDVDLKSIPSYEKNSLIKKISVLKMNDLEKCYEHVSAPEALQFFQDLKRRNEASPDSSVQGENVVEEREEEFDVLELKGGRDRTVSEIIKGYKEVVINNDRISSRNVKRTVEWKQKKKKKKKAEQVSSATKVDVEMLDNIESFENDTSRENVNNTVHEVDIEMLDNTESLENDGSRETPESSQQAIVIEKLGRGKRLKRKTVKYTA